jgi:hypothetical protein
MMAAAALGQSERVAEIRSDTMTTLHLVDPELVPPIFLPRLQAKPASGEPLHYVHNTLIQLADADRKSYFPANLPGKPS